MKITVLMGGTSSERNVSLASGIRIVQANPARSLDESDKWLNLFESVVVRRR